MKYDTDEIEAKGVLASVFGVLFQLSIKNRCRKYVGMGNHIDIDLFVCSNKLIDYQKANK